MYSLIRLVQLACLRRAHALASTLFEILDDLTLASIVVQGQWVPAAFVPRHDLRSLFRQLFSSIFIKGAGPQHLAWMDELQSRTMLPDDAWRLQNSFAMIDVTGLLARVSVPTLVLHARDDAVAPLESGKIFAYEIPGARFIELDSPNHILLEGEPAFDEFVEHVNAFLASTVNRGLSLVRRQY